VSTVVMGAEATAPPEHRGLARDEVRLLVVRPGDLHDAVFRDLPEHLEPGDLVVVNTSATLPARLDVRRADGTATHLHVSTSLDDGDWVVELRRPDGDGPERGVEPGTEVDLPGGVRLRLLAAFPDPARPSRLWRARPEPSVDRVAHLRRYGGPIRYGYLPGAPTHADPQNL
jgi:S-adenosylmethionine:tRNA ribosyltransferase-isomerase